MYGTQENQIAISVHNARKRGRGMNLKLLKYIVTVAEERNLTRAAARLRISQPSLTQNINNLETQLGAQLFDRSVSPLELTYAGNIYVSWAKSVLLGEMETYQKIKKISGPKRTRLSVGLASHRSLIMIPPIARPMFEKFPNCDFSYINGTMEELLSKLNVHTLDLVIGSGLHSSVHYSNIHITEEQLVLAAPVSYGLSKVAYAPEYRDYPAIQLAQINTYPLIAYPEDFFLGRSIRDLCEQENFVAHYRIECTNVELGHTLVGQGLGICLLPELYVRLSPPLEGVEYFTLKGRSISRSVTLTYTNGRALSNEAKYFIDLFRKEFGS